MRCPKDEWRVGHVCLHFGITTCHHISGMLFVGSHCRLECHLGWEWGRASHLVKVHKVLLGLWTCSRWSLTWWRFEVIWRWEGGVGVVSPASTLFIFVIQAKKGVIWGRRNWLVWSLLETWLLRPPVKSIIDDDDEWDFLTRSCLSFSSLTWWH